MIEESLQTEIDDFYSRQFREWPEVEKSYRELGRVMRKIVKVGDFDVIVQCNPARAVSTGAKVDPESIKRRPCFLCERNRPKEQIKGEAISGFDVLVNPYPIFPVHFTVASQVHEPQEKMPLEMVEFVDRHAGLAAFFNGSKAGASAPDHLHFQAIRADELPLLSLVERLHPGDKSSVISSKDFGLDLPMRFESIVIRPDILGQGLLALLPSMTGEEPGLVNQFVWKDPSGVLRALVFRRRAHRPHQYFEEGEKQLMISPGAIDMAGVVITPRRADFEKITADELRDIYSQV